ncbi:arylsulfatase B-like [Branchiostoma floridae]|uniref:Arylsulfatase B-like n=1 Tax=Branchiostoma floridae TaxID=7739 RepID=A0A9J7MI30_BRAFL|nr:arylsulfatase B-like [Branchiostoma floridae]
MSTMMLRVPLLLLTGALVGLVSAQDGSQNATKPHILFIVADDLGWNDVGWHNPDVKTPVLDKLAHEGVILNQSYVNYVCTPSRTAFMTGYYPYHAGSQHLVFLPQQAQGIPYNFTFLPEKLKDLGYATHMVGKWHLGFCNWKYTPTYRGFDSFYGYYNADEDYYTHVVAGGLDLRDDKEVVNTKNGQYGTYFFTDRMVDIIEKHPADTPLFLYLPFQNVHEPLEVPERFENIYMNVQNENRRKLLGMVSALDEAVGNVTMAMKNAGLWDNTLVIFTTDNGGWIIASGNNYPLRGGKVTLWEGGTRGVAFVHGKMLQKTGYTNNEMIHAVDWFPTILAAAGGTADDAMDGVSQLDTIMSGQPSPRTEFVYNIDDVFPTKQGAIRVGDYKLIEGVAGKPDGWIHPDNLTDSQLDSGDPTSGTWLFNLKDDPTEHHNLADSMPDKLKEMQAKLAEYRKSLVPAINPPPDPKSFPKNWGGAWSPGWC